MKLWDKGTDADSVVIQFTAERDRFLDTNLAVWDIVGSMAHCVMLHEAGIISGQEKGILLEALNSLFEKAGHEKPESGDGFEDIHSRIEADLVRLTGDTGKKIHTGRSRNDQVLTDIYLFLRYEMSQISGEVFLLLNQLLSLSDEHAEVMLPGYTHLQPAMPSTFGLWFGSYAESLCDDIDSLHFAGRAVNASPSGTAAGYGTTLPLKREIIADLLGFDRLIVNSAYAQLRRGKAEKCAADAIASVAFTLGRLAGDIILFLTKEFSFISFSDSLTTGSSIMPQKKNPDVFEIVRARANLLRSLPNTLSMMTTNLPSGYNRDFQVMKEVIFPAIEEVKSLIAMTSYMMRGITVRHDIIDSSYNMIFSAEAVNELVINGVPFREAYRTVALTVGRELFRETTTADYSHIGSMGNTGNEAVLSRASGLMAEFQTATASDLVSGIISG